MKTTIAVVPFAQFGNPGTAAGAELVGDAVREMLADNRDETRPTRARKYQNHVRVRELPLATTDDFSQWRERARQMAANTLDAGEFLIWIGGNHLSVLPLYEELAARDGSAVIQFDAHLDVYHLRDCKSDLSHGNFLRQLPAHRPAIVNVGHRDLFLPAEEVARYFIESHSINEVTRNSTGVEKAVRDLAARHQRVCIDIDWDVLDPAYFPAVVDALPFGLAPQQLLAFVQSLVAGSVALAISEFDPGRDDRDRSMELAVWLIEQVLLWRYES